MIREATSCRNLLRVAPLCAFALTVCAPVRGQQINCPITSDGTNSSASAFNALNPCAIEAPAKYSNSGTLTNKSGATISAAFGTQLYNLTGGTFVNDGTLNTQGYLENDASLTNNGSVGASIFFNVGAATLTNSASATLELTSGAAAPSGNSGTLHNSGTFKLDGGAIFNSSGALTNGSLTNTTATISGAFDSQLYNLTGGTLVNYGTLSTQGYFENDASLTNKGSLGASIFFNVGAATLTNSAGATLELTSGAAAPSGNSGTLHNSGTFKLDGGAIFNSSGALTNGSLTNAGATISGAFGSQIYNVTGGTLVNYGILSTQGYFENDASLTNKGSLGASIFFNVGAATLTNSAGATLELTEGIASPSGNSATLNNNGTFKLDAGTVFDNSGTLANGSLTNSAATISGALASQLYNVTGGTLVNYGTLSTRGYLENDASLTNSGTLTLEGGATFHNVATLTNSGTIAGPGVLENVGTIQGSGQLKGVIENQGTILANDPAKALVISGTVTEPLVGLGQLGVSDGGTLTIDPTTVSAQLVYVDSGTLNGDGTINVEDGVGNGGKIAPGRGAPGALTINGTYTQEHQGTLNGVLEFLLGGGGAGQYSQLDVDGNAFFDSGSVVEADFFGGFNPASACDGVVGICETFDVLNAEDISSVTTTFDPVTMTFTTTTTDGISGVDFDLPALESGLSWSELDSNNDLLLEITSSGQTSGGGGGGGGGGGTSVPEPSTILLFATGILALGARRVRSRSRAGERLRA